MRSMLAAMAGLICASAAHGPAQAQALLDHATPAPGVTVSTPPEHVELVFQQPLAEKGSDIELRDETGKRLDKGDAHVAPDAATKLGVAVQVPLHAGAYDVIWHAASADAPTIMGHYRFTVGGPATTPAKADTKADAKADSAKPDAAKAETGKPESPVAVTELWARATPPGATTGVVYLTLTSKADDKLTAITSPAAQDVAAHEMTMSGGIMRMNPLPNGVELPAGKPVAMIPGGMHVMLTGLKAPLKPNETVPLHLTFQHAPPMDLAVPIQSIGATHEPHAMPGMHH